MSLRVCVCGGGGGGVTGPKVDPELLLGAL